MVYYYVVPGLNVKIIEGFSHGAWFGIASHSPIEFTEHMSFVGTYKHSAKFRLPYRPDEKTVGAEVGAEISNYFYRCTRFDFMCPSTDIAHRYI